MERAPRLWVSDDGSASAAELRRALAIAYTYSDLPQDVASWAASGRDVLAALLPLGAVDAGLGTMNDLRKNGFRGAVVFYAEGPHPAVVRAALRAGAQDVLEPLAWNESRLVDALRNCLDRQEGQSPRESASPGEFFREAESLAHFGTWHVELDTWSARWSAEMRAIMGLGRDEPPLSLEGYGAMVVPDDRERAVGELLELFRRGIPFDSKHRIVRPDGREVSVRAIGHAELLPDGAVARAFGVTLDVSEQVALGRQLQDRALELESVLGERRATERKLRQLVDANLMGVVFASSLRGVYEVNDAFLAIVGYSRTECEAKEIDWLALTPPEWRSVDRAAILQVQSVKRSYRWEKEYIRKDGTRVPVLLSATPLDGEEGEMLVLVDDLSEQHRAETRLRESERSLSSLLQFAPVGIAFIDRSGQWIRANEALCHMLGYEEHELFAIPYYAMTHPSDRPEDAGLLERLTSGALPSYHREKRYVKKDGSELWVSVSASVIRADDGSAIGLGAIIQDIGQRKGAEMALAKTMGLWRSMLDSAPYAIVSMAPDGIIREYNLAAERLLGYPASEVVDQRDLTLFHDVEELARQAAELGSPNKGQLWAPFEVLVHNARQHASGEREWTYVRRDGRRWTGLLSMTAQRDKAGEIVGFLAVIQDITERKRHEREKRLGEARLRAITETANDGILTADAAGVIRYANARAEHIFGRTREELAGQPLTVLMPERFREAHVRGLARFLVHGQARVIGKTVELAGVRANGEEFPLELSLATWEVNGERAFTGLVRDISERKRAEGELLRSKDAAEEATRAKSSFLARMSHEIRTPLNGMIGMTELALRTDLSPVQRDHVQIAHVSALGLLTIVNDLLDFSKIEAGKLQLEHAPFVLRDCLESVVRGLTPLAEEKGITLALDLPERCVVVGDSLRLRQILVNLVGNALKFTERGEVRVRVVRTATSEQGSNLDFSVQDDGIGISQDRLSLIFQPFRQAEESTSRKYGGTGLGLSICSQLVELMGGHIQVESTVGQGSKFHFCLHMPHGEMPHERCLDAPAEPPARLPPLHILVAEDNPINQRVVCGLLQNGGHTVVCVDNGRDAVQRTSSEHFDAVLMDVQMPELDGMSATLAIRQRELAHGGHLWIIALTAQAIKGDREKCLECGMDDYLVKPLSSAHLVHALLRTVGRDNGQLPSTRPAQPGAVWDDAGIRELVGENFSLLQDVIEVFREQCPLQLADIDAAIAARDLPRVQEATHKIKGALASLGAVRSSQAARELEQAAARGQSAACVSLATTLSLEVTKFEDVLALTFPRTNS